MNDDDVKELKKGIGHLGNLEFDDKTYISGKRILYINYVVDNNGNVNVFKIKDVNGKIKVIYQDCFRLIKDNDELRISYEEFDFDVDYNIVDLSVNWNRLLQTIERVWNSIDRMMLEVRWEYKKRKILAIGRDE